VITATPVNHSIMFIHTCNTFRCSEFSMLKLSSPRVQAWILIVVFYLVCCSEMFFWIMLVENFITKVKLIHISALSAYLWAFISIESGLSLLFHLSCYNFGSCIEARIGSVRMTKVSILSKCLILDVLPTYMTPSVWNIVHIIIHCSIIV